MGSISVVWLSKVLEGKGDDGVCKLAGMAEVLLPSS
jgi:hypothetical protein